MEVITPVKHEKIIKEIELKVYFYNENNRLIEGTTIYQHY